MTRTTTGSDSIDDHFGVCPTCGKTDGYLNIGSRHWFVCHAHRVRWCVGSNLFSSWRDETKEQWQANADRIEDYQEIEPAPGPEASVYLAALAGENEVSSRRTDAGPLQLREQLEF